MSPEPQRDKVLVIDDDEGWRGIAERNVGRILPSHKVLSESTRDGAMAAIDREAATLFAVITDYSLTAARGSAEGGEIAAHARSRDIPKVVILTGEAGAFEAPEGVTVLSKASTDIRSKLAAILGSGDGN